MNPDHYFSILCKYFVFFGIRFDLDFSWPTRLIAIICSCTFNLFKANRLLALYLELKRENLPLRIAQMLQLSFDVWLYFYLLLNQDAISDHMNNLASNLPKQVKSRFVQKLKLYRIVYLVFVIDTIRLAVLWYLSGTVEIYQSEFPYLNASTIESVIGSQYLILPIFVLVSLVNKLLNTMLLAISVFLYLFIYYAQHLLCWTLSEQSELYSNLREFKERYRICQKISLDSNSAFGILPFIWFVSFSTFRSFCSSIVK